METYSGKDFKTNEGEKLTPTLAFYLCVDFIAVSLLACADSMISDYRRNMIQSGGRIFFLNRTFVLKAYHLCFIVSFLVLFLVIALRDHVGIDYNAYAQVYLYINGVGGSVVNENWLSPGFIVLCKLVGMLAPRTYELMFAVMGFLTMYFLYKAIYKMSCCWWLSLYIFICFCLYYQCFNQFRQLCAISLTTYACSFLHEKRTKKFFMLYVLLAASIHKSAIVMMILYFIANLEINKKNILFYVGVFVFFHVAYDVTLWIITNFTSYGGYIDSKYGLSMETSAIQNTFLRFIMLIGSLLFVRKTVNRNPRTLIYYNSVIICTILTTLSVRVHIIARMSTYFYVIYIFLVPEVLKTLQSYMDKFMQNITLLLTVISFMIYHFVYYFHARTETVYNMMFFSLRYIL